jgi:hypothetical protein
MHLDRSIDNLASHFLDIHNVRPALLLYISFVLFEFFEPLCFKSSRS